MPSERKFVSQLSRVSVATATAAGLRGDISPHNVAYGVHGMGFHADWDATLHLETSSGVCAESTLSIVIPQNPLGFEAAQIRQPGASTRPGRGRDKQRHEETDYLQGKLTGKMKIPQRPRLASSCARIIGNTVGRQRLRRQRCPPVPWDSAFPTP